MSFALRALWCAIFGVLSSHSKFRSEVVPKPLQDSSAFKPPPASGDQLLFPKLNGGPMRWLEAATTEQAATALLAKLGLAPQPPPTPPPVLFGQLRLRFC